MYAYDVLKTRSLPFVVCGQIGDVMEATNNCVNIRLPHVNTYYKCKRMHLIGLVCNNNLIILKSITVHGVSE